MSLTALPSTSTTTTAPSTLAEAFFRMHWTSLSVRARTGSWWPLLTHFDRQGKLLREDKVPLLAAAVREVYWVYGERCAWELQCHPYVNWKGEAFVGWSYEGVLKEEGNGEFEDGEEVREVWRGITERARSVGLKVGEVHLDGTGLAAFARVRELTDEEVERERVMVEAGRSEVSFWVDGVEWKGRV